MARAGYCSACGQNVYQNADGSCVNGHAATYVSNTYEVPGAIPAPGSASPGPAPFVKSTAASATSVYGKETWKGATLTVDSHVVQADKTTSDVAVRLGDESGAWKVQSLTSDGQTIPFDAGGFKAFVDAANK